MNEAKTWKLANKERIKKVKQYVLDYQSAFRELRDFLPDDDQIEPFLIAAAIGKIEIYPCLDAAIVLVYDDNSPKIGIKVKDSVNKTVAEFVKKSNAFIYFDENGNSVSVRIIFNENFLNKKHDMTNVIAWANEISAPSRTYDKNSFFRPRFKRMTILGWETPLSNAKADASTDIQRAYAFANVLKANADDAGQRTRLVGVANQLLKEFETSLNSESSEDDAKRLLQACTELIHPAYLRCYKNIELKKGLVADCLILIWDNGPRCLLVYFGDVHGLYVSSLNKPSSTLLDIKKKFSDLEALLGRFPGQANVRIPRISDLENITQLYVLMGRSKQFTYLGRKNLRENHCDRKQYFDTYDDVHNKFLATIGTLSGIWDNFESVNDQLVRLGILSEEDFNETLETIDQEMRLENLAVPAFQLQGWLRFSSVFGLYLINKDPLSSKIFSWFEQKYGDELNVDLTWKFLISVRDTLYRLRIPFILGTVEFVCSPQLYRSTEPIVADGEKLPKVNVLDLIDDFTNESARSLNQDELFTILNQFQFALGISTALERISDISLASEAKKHLADCVLHFLETPFNYDSLRDSLRLATKNLLISFIDQAETIPAEIPDLNDLMTKAESLGLHGIDHNTIKDLQELSKKRSAPPRETKENFLNAYYKTLEICSSIANQIFLIRNYRPVNEIEAGEYYTNSLGKIYKCMKVEGDHAEILLLDEVMGNTLEILFTQHRNYWNQYYWIEDQAFLKEFTERYESMKTKGADNQETP